MNILLTVRYFCLCLFAGMQLPAEQQADQSAIGNVQQIAEPKATAFGWQLD